MNTTTDQKAIAAQVAGMLAAENPDRAAIEIVLRSLGYPAEPATRETTYEDDYDFEGNIGIYQPVQQNGGTAYIRDPRCKDRWSYYADVQEIPVKTYRKRVVLLGESVARGFLLDPDFTPAFVLQSLLGVNTASEDYEVIDLAETNLGMGGLRRRFDQCLALQPDLVVFLAANNWRTDLQVHIDTNPVSYQQVEQAIKSTGGLQGVKAVVEEIFSGLVSDFIRETGTIAKEHNLPLLFIVPEFNLVDCKSTPGERYVSFLPGTKISEWLNLRDRAIAAKDAGDFSAVLTLADEMIKADITHPMGYELRAAAHAALQQNEEARRDLQLARDTALFCRTNSKPRIFEIVKEVMRREFPKYGTAFIEAGEVFSRHLKGALPDRRLFLDYCHFTVEGIQVLMEAAAEKILSILSGPDTRSMVAARTVLPEKDTYAYSHLFAAIHNAHWGQPYPILEYHAAKALSYSRDIARVMIYYCEMMSRATSNNLCKSFELLIRDKRIDKYVHTMIHPRHQKTMELDLVDAMVNAMKNAGIQMEAVVRDLRVKEHGVQLHKIDLLKPCYHATSYDEYQGTQTAFYQSRDNRSRFFLAAAEHTPVTLQLTLRIRPANYKSREVRVLAGNGFSAGFEASEAWKDYTVAIPAEYISNGINYIDICWPSGMEVKSNGTDAGSKLGDSSRSLLDASFYVFGEIIIFNAVADVTKEPAPSESRSAVRETSLV